MLPVMGTSGSKTYLAVVDDDPSVCRALSRLLRESGYQAVSYSSAEEFLRDQNHPRFDCLLLDLQLAELSGIALQRELAAAGDVAPIIFITASDDLAAREQARQFGAIAYFHKTAPGDELLRVIRSVVSQQTGNP